MKEALCYQSNREMRLHGNAIHMKPTPDGALAMDVQSSEAVYVSDVFDCGEVSGTWDELHLHFEQLWELQASVWMFDAEAAKTQLLTLSVEDQFHVIRQKGFTQNSSDMLLYGRGEAACGRYLVFCFQVRKPKGNHLYFTGYELSFPAVLFSEYLPYVYQNNPTLDAYLSVFKDVYLSLEDEIDRFYEQLDPESATEENLRELLTWQGLEKFQDYAELAALRMLPALWNRIYREKGSLFYLSELIRFLFQAEVCMHEKEQTLQVYVQATNMQKEQKLLLFFRQEIPADITVSVHFIRQCYMDHNAYLGITSSLQNTNRPMQMAGMNQGDYMK